MTYETITVEIADKIATITLNRPDARNALNVTRPAEFDQTLVQIARDDTVRVVVLTGAAGTFCAGGDVRGMNNEPDRTAEQWRAHLRRSRLCSRAAAPPVLQLHQHLVRTVDCG